MPSLSTTPQPGGIFATEGAALPAVGANADLPDFILPRALGFSAPAAAEISSADDDEDARNRLVMTVLGQAIVALRGAAAAMRSLWGDISDGMLADALALRFADLVECQADADRDAKALAIAAAAQRELGGA
ncbi:hypothetical protein [Paracraurococcus ruber]|uniref:Uncharacterized protein n=1 Tax=Paracraurococcus ruber TaxID=77675 RepID=A0ABS1CSQ1_9PROT|nr:hypothetical protein [Paracraurococcus ruber]MBK1656869.1 hypothetical protein [Paracraurococcus ruber]TDG33983.1 hypothetical protein E2C05_01710 [Paracraurococcus ruber]